MLDANVFNMLSSRNPKDIYSADPAPPLEKSRIRPMQRTRDAGSSDLLILSQTETRIVDLSDQLEDLQYRLALASIQDLGFDGGFPGLAQPSSCILTIGQERDN